MVSCPRGALACVHTGDTIFFLRGDPTAWGNMPTMPSDAATIATRYPQKFAGPSMARPRRWDTASVVAPLIWAWLSPGSEWSPPCVPLDIAPYGQSGGYYAVLLRPGWTAHPVQLGGGRPFLVAAQDGAGERGWSLFTLFGL